MKRTMLAQEIDRRGAEIIFVQETHFRGEFKTRIHYKRSNLAYYSNNTQKKSRGAAILIASTAAFTEMGVRTDPRGRFVFVKGMYNGTLDRSRPTTQGRLNETLLDDHRVLEDLRQTVATYFKENSGTEVSDPWVWEAHKGVIRGILIKWGARLKKERSHKLEALTADITTAETRHKQDPTNDNLQKLTALRLEFRTLLTTRAYRSIQLTRGTFYAQGNRSGKLLARALKAKQQKSFINKIVGDSGRQHNTTEDIAKAFTTFYADLYNLTPPTTQPHTLWNYISDNISCRIPVDQIHTLDEPFTHAELLSTIKTLPNGKSPGPDGLTARYYRTLKQELAPHFLRTLNGLALDSTLPPPMLRTPPSHYHESTQRYKPLAPSRILRLTQISVRFWGSQSPQPYKHDSKGYTHSPGLGQD
ncbi:Hypothetical predicted protein [Pelobates cultripes]|uniref:Reverse transcriptase n=1 Tax=Pelobates cultripes TaxID=61616 RepID=A0AAD1RBT9_PELCU|nr:Hypothetical predicted protein [Pelobates cultripes]